MIWRILITVTAFLLLGAHFLRGGLLFLTAACLLAPLLLLLKRRWALRTLQGLLYVGALVWLHTAYILAQQRLAANEPWMRMLLILGAVAGYTIAAAALLNSPTLKKRYS